MSIHYGRMYLLHIDRWVIEMFCVCISFKYCQRYQPIHTLIYIRNPQIVRAYLVHFHTQVLQRHNGIRQSQSQPAFNFRGGSIGNFFFAGARIFFGSLPAAIFLFSKVAGIPSGSRVVPAVLTEDRLVLGAELKDWTRIRGQFNISHPRPELSNDTTQTTIQHENEHRQVIKKSSEVASLHSSPIQRISYLLNDPTWKKNNQQHTQSLDNNSTQQQQWSSRNEITPEPNPQVLDAISNANCIVYGCGSLFTSVLPSLVLDGVGSAISSRYVYKVLLLNGWHDCETSWVEKSNEDDGSSKQVVKQMNANSIVQAVIDALDQDGSHSNNDDDDDEDNGSSTITTDYITHIFYPLGTEIDIDEQSLLKLGIEVRGIESIPANTCSEGSRSGGQSHHVVYDTKCLVDALLSLAAV